MNDLGTLERHGGAYVLQWERRLAHPPAKVWAAITDPDQMRAWWAEAEIDLQPGGEVVLRWLNVPEGGEPAILHGTVTALEPERALEIRGDLHGTIRFDLEPRDDGGTTLRFTNVLDLEAQEWLSKSLAGWHTHLEHLDDFLDAGTRVGWEHWYVGPIRRWEELHARYVAAYRA